MLQHIFLQAGAPGAGGLGWFFPLMLMLIIFIFFIYLPRKQQKEREKVWASLREGMEVYTSSGIVGRVVRIEGNAVRLQIDEKLFVRVLKSTIVGEFK